MSASADWPTFLIIIMLAMATAGLLISAYIALRIGGKLEAVATKVDAVHKGIEIVKVEVTTLNSQTLAQLIDAEETRRITAIRSEDRTSQEASHIEAMRGEELRGEEQ